MVESRHHILALILALLAYMIAHINFANPHFPHTGGLPPTRVMQRILVILIMHTVFISIWISIASNIIVKMILNITKFLVAVRVWNEVWTLVSTYSTRTRVLNVNVWTPEFWRPNKVLVPHAAAKGTSEKKRKDINWMWTYRIPFYYWKNQDGQHTQNTYLGHQQEA